MRIPRVDGESWAWLIGTAAGWLRRWMRLDEEMVIVGEKLIDAARSGEPPKGPVDTWECDWCGLFMDRPIADRRDPAINERPSGWAANGDETLTWCSRKCEAEYYRAERDGLPHHPRA